MLLLQLIISATDSKEKMWIRQKKNEYPSKMKTGLCVLCKGWVKVDCLLDGASH